MASFRAKSDDSQRPMVPETRGAARFAHLLSPPDSGLLRLRGCYPDPEHLNPARRPFSYNGGGGSGGGRCSPTFDTEYLANDASDSVRSGDQGHSCFFDPSSPPVSSWRIDPTLTS